MFTRVYKEVESKKWQAKSESAANLEHHASTCGIDMRDSLADCMQLRVLSVSRISCLDGGAVRGVGVEPAHESAHHLHSSIGDYFLLNLRMIFQQSRIARAGL